MSLDAILDSIRAGGDARIAQIDAEAQTRIDAILADARVAADRLRDEARSQTAARAVKERARLLQEARLDALQTVGTVRETLIDEALAKTCERFAVVRSRADYPDILRRLLDEALASLGPSLNAEEQPELVIDPRDRALLDTLLNESGRTVTISEKLDCLGGVIARSSDGDVVVINTLEARFERALPYLRRALAAFFEKNHTDALA